MNFTLRSKRYNPKTKNVSRARFKTERLKNPQVVEELQRKVHNQLASSELEISSADPDTCWTIIKNTIFEASSHVVGLDKHKKQEDWYNENRTEIDLLLEQKHHAFQATINNPNNQQLQERHKFVKLRVRKEIRDIKNKWWSDKANEIQLYADQHDSRSFFEAIKKIYEPSRRNLNPVKDSTGRLLKDEELIRNRWRDHYSLLLNQHSNINLEAIDLIPQYSENAILDQIPTIEEISKALKEMKNNKSAGNDGIPAEILKCLVPEIVPHLKVLFDKIWSHEQVPQDFRDALIVNIFKKKGDPADCGNYRGISLLVVAGKILARVMSNRLLPYLDKLLPQSQCGFRPNRSTIDMIFALRQLQEKVIEQQEELHVAFVDITKAFDSIDRNTLWKIMFRFGIPSKFVAICKSLHVNNWSRVAHNGKITDPFQTHTGVRQGCVLAPLLFNIFMAALSIIVDRKLTERGIGIRYRYDGGLFNLGRLRATTKTRLQFITELMYADDCALVAHSHEQLQQILNIYAWAYEALGLRINIKKTKILSTPRDVDYNPSINISGQQLENVEHFNYLGSILNTNANVDIEVRNRISAASRSFWKLRNRVFQNHDLSLKTKTAVYRAVVIPTLLYGCETWVPYARHIKALERALQRHLRQIMHIRWYHRVSNNTVLMRANCASIEIQISQARLRWTGHMVRMDDNRIVKNILYGELCEGRRRQGGQRHRYKDILHETLKSVNVADRWEETARDRSEWRRVVASYGGPRVIHRHVPAPGHFECPECGRVITSRIGLFSHRRTHNR